MYTPSRPSLPVAVQQEVNDLKGFKHFRENGASQGQNLALTVLCVPSSLDSSTPCLPSLPVATAPP